MIQLSSRKLNLGCGRDKRAGYLNVDMGPYHNPDVLANVLDLVDFPSGYYEEIISLGVIEHFKRTDTRRALYEWNRVLALGGRLILTTTYLDGLIRKLEAPSLQSVAGHELIVETLFAGQMAEGDFHLTAFTELLMRYYLWECGFEIDQLGLHKGWLFEVEARKSQDYSLTDALAVPEDVAFLRLAYHEILYREIDAAGLAHYEGVLTRHELTRPQVVKELLLSPERKQTMIARAPEFPREFDPRVALADESPVRQSSPSLLQRLVGRLLHRNAKVRAVAAERVPQGRSILPDS